MHALGLKHAHTRPDRDDYVEIKWENIQSGMEHNFKKCTNCLTYGVAYDAKSIMHYKSAAFAIYKSYPTIVSKVRSFS